MREPEKPDTANPCKSPTQSCGIPIWKVGPMPAAMAPVSTPVPISPLDMAAVTAPPAAVPLKPQCLCVPARHELG